MTSDGDVLTCSNCDEQWTRAATDVIAICPNCSTLWNAPTVDAPTDQSSFPGLPDGESAVGESAILAMTEEQPPKQPAASEAPVITTIEEPTTPTPGAEQSESPSEIARGFLSWAASNETAESVSSDDSFEALAEATIEQTEESTTPFLSSPVADGDEENTPNVAVPVLSSPVTPEATTAEAAPPTQPQGEFAKGPPPVDGVPRHWFVLLAGYASAVTIALIWLWLTGGRMHPLESLPDVIPKTDAEGKTAYPFPRDDDAMPFGHTLKFDETQRFGNLEITPLRVTRGPLQLAGAIDSADGDDVLRLWLRVRNVSDDQTIRPFGKELMLLRSSDKRVNTFVAQNDNRTKTRIAMWTYELDADGYALKDQQLDRALKPGEQYDTYLASDYGIDELQGALIWRVHVRKGHNPKSKRGVTTLFEVLFHSEEITQETLGG